MSTISARGRLRRKTWTVADLHRRFGPIPFERIRQNPPPGSGTVDDVVRLSDHEDRLYELVDGILLEKTVGLLESWIAMRIKRCSGTLPIQGISGSSQARQSRFSSIWVWFGFLTSRLSPPIECRAGESRKNRFRSSFRTWLSK